MVMVLYHGGHLEKGPPKHRSWQRMTSGPGLYLTRYEEEAVNQYARGGRRLYVVEVDEGTCATKVPVTPEFVADLRALCIGTRWAEYFERTHVWPTPVRVAGYVNLVAYHQVMHAGRAEDLVALLARHGAHYYADSRHVILYDYARMRFTRIARNT